MSTAARRARVAARIALAVVTLATCGGVRGSTPDAPTSPSVSIEWNARIPLRDGVELAAIVYRPRSGRVAPYCVATMTPYVAQSYHDRGMYFASYGIPFVSIDVRGRGNSDGTFRPNLQEGADGHDVVEWLAAQSYCHGQVAMWGGSYAGYAQWVTARERPPHLRSIVPVASPMIGVDFPSDGRIFYPYALQWLALTAGRTSQSQLAADPAFWVQLFRERYERGLSFRSLSSVLGAPNPHFDEWISHPNLDAWSATYGATAEQLARIDVPVLTITGAYDQDQPGALAWYRAHVGAASPMAKSRHFLVIGPWDHGGTRTPSTRFRGRTVGDAALVDLPRLHRKWYEWTMAEGARPPFLSAPVKWYLMGADEWRDAPSLEAITGEHLPFHLSAARNPTSVEAAGDMQLAAGSGRGRYVYDPRDVSTAALQASMDSEDVADARLVLARAGHELVYQTAPLSRDLDVAGFFRLTAWIAIDRPDTDFQAAVYEVRPDGSSLLLTSQRLRARYRTGDVKPVLIDTNAPLPYRFDRFTFVATRLRAGARLRLVIDSVDSIYRQRNFNSGGDVNDETFADARPVTVTLRHDARCPSVLEVPIARGE